MELLPAGTGVVSASERRLVGPRAAGNGRPRGPRPGHSGGDRERVDRAARAARRLGVGQDTTIGQRPDKWDRSAPRPQSRSRVSRRAQPRQERRGPVQGVVEDRLERVPEARVGHQLGVRERGRRPPAAARSARTGPTRPTAAGPGSGSPASGAIRASVRSGRAGRVERVAEQDEAGVRRVRARPRRGSRRGRRTSGHRPRRPPPTGTTAWKAGSGVLGLAPRQVDRDRVDAARAQAVHERRHAGGRPARAVAQEAAHAHAPQRTLPWAVRLPGHGPVGSWPSTRTHRPSSLATRTARAMPRSRDRRIETPGTRARRRPPRSLAAVLLAATIGAGLAPRGGPRRDADAPALEPAPSPSPTPAPAARRSAAGPTVLGDDRHVLRARLRPRRRACRSTARAAGRSPARTRPTILAHYYQGAVLAPIDPGDPDPRARPVEMGGERADARCVIYGRLHALDDRRDRDDLPGGRPLRLIPHDPLDRVGHVAPAWSTRADGTVLFDGAAPGDLTVRGDGRGRPPPALVEADPLRPVPRHPADPRPVGAPACRSSTTSRSRRTCAASCRSRCRRPGRPRRSRRRRSPPARTRRAGSARRVSYFDVPDDSTLAGLPRRPGREADDQRGDRGHRRDRPAERLDDRQHPVPFDRRRRDRVTTRTSTRPPAASGSPGP